MRSTHAPPHGDNPGLHDAAHVPPLQSGVAPEHTTPHAPQSFGSLAGSTHTPLHATRSAPQAHAPLPHTSVGPHAFGHEPQCSAFVRVSTQAPAQFERPGVHVVAHAPALHTGALPEHAVVQVPQWAGSVLRSTH